METKKTQTQLCWSCQKAVGLCRWSAVGMDGKIMFDPIPGWKTECVERIFDGVATKIDLIVSCPEYLQDKPKKSGVENIIEDIEAEYLDKFGEMVDGKMVVQMLGAGASKQKISNKTSVPMWLVSEIERRVRKLGKEKT